MEEVLVFGSDVLVKDGLFKELEVDEELFETELRLESTLDLTAFISGVCLKVGEEMGVVEVFENLEAISLVNFEVDFSLRDDGVLVFSMDELCFSKSLRVWGFNFLTFGVEGGIGDVRVGEDDSSLLSKRDLNVLTDTLEAREFIEDLCAIEEIEDMVDILDTDDIFESLFFLSKFCGLNKLDLEFTGIVSQSKNSSEDSEILSLFLKIAMLDCGFLSFSSSLLMVKFLGSKRSSLRFSRYSFKISLLEPNLEVT